MQTFGLLSLLFGVGLIVAVSSLLGYLLSAVFVTAAGASAIAGVFLLRGHFIGADASKVRSAVCLIFGTTLIFSGFELIVGSNIAFEYIIISDGKIQSTSTSAPRSQPAVAVSQHIHSSFFITNASPD